MSDQPEDLKLLKDIAVEWFKIHADQRLKAFNFFIIISGFLFTGYFAALSQKNQQACMFVGFLVFLMCIVFKFLDMRTAQLLKVGEAAVREVLARIDIASEAKNIIDKSNDKGCVFSYRQSFNFLFFIFGVVGAVGLIYPLFWRLC